MATQVRTQEPGIMLHQTVQRWESRRRWQRFVARLPFSLLLALLAGVTLGVVSRIRPLLLPDQLLLVTVAILVASIIGLFLLTFFRGRTTLDSARHFDIQFGLQERVSTALELLEGRIHTHEALINHQLQDATDRAQGVAFKEELPMQYSWRLWVAALPLLIAFILLLILPNPQATAISSITARQAALDETVDDLKDITEQIAADTTLTDEERAELLQALQNSQDTLERPEVTTEEAFASLSEAGSQLQEQADLFDQQVNAERQALENAAESLRNLNPEDSQTQQEQQSVSDMLDALAENAAQMSEEQRQNAANALQQAANQLSATNPEAAQQLGQASQSLRQGDTQAAQQQLQQASEQLQQDQQQAQQQAELAQQLQESSQQLQQQAQQLSQQGQPEQGDQQQNSANQQGNAPENQNTSGQPQQANQPGQDGQQGDQNNEKGAAQSLPGQGETGQSGAPQDGQGQVQQLDPSGSQQGQNPGNAPDAVGASAGDSPGGAGSEDEGIGQGNTIQGNNNPDGTGEGQFESIFSPRRIGGQSDEQIILEADASDAPTIEGEFAENAPGDVAVPYNQVFSDYSNAANRALESGYIPLGLRDVVRDYFASLEPGSGQ
ncbi:MAG: hypothetical protein H6672_03845 [Anaerolineaceae bacterium]|nr:hypothetical protein [Anaerolineaceae bacterium]